MNLPTTRIELAKLLNTSPTNLRNQLIEANGQINFNAETDELTPEQLAKWLPRYVTQGTKTYLRDETKRRTVEAMLLQLNGNGTQTESETQVKQTPNERPTKPPTERQPKANETIRQLQNENERLLLLLKKSTNELANENEGLREQIKAFNEIPMALKWLGRDSTRVVLMFILASFEFAGTLELLKHKGLWLALPVAFAMSFALLVFTASSNRFGQWFCIAFAFALGSIYFELLPRTLADWLFAFVPPTVTAIIVNSFNRK